MKEGFRQAMAWLHTWAGLTFGWLLFAIFLTGTLAYALADAMRGQSQGRLFAPLDAAV